VIYTACQTSAASGLCCRDSGPLCVAWRQQQTAKSSTSIAIRGQTSQNQAQYLTDPCEAGEWAFDRLAVPLIVQLCRQDQSASRRAQLSRHMCRRVRPAPAPGHCGLFTVHSKMKSSGYRDTVQHCFPSSLRLGGHDDSAFAKGNQTSTGTSSGGEPGSHPCPRAGPPDVRLFAGPKRGLLATSVKLRIFESSPSRNSSCPLGNRATSCHRSRNQRRG